MTPTGWRLLRRSVGDNMIRQHLLALLALALCLTVPVRSGAEIVTIEAPGNLISTYDIGCADVSKLNNKLTPADLYRGMSICLQHNNFRDGAFLFALAGVYGRYDTYRVSDTTAHQATAALQVRTLGPVGQVKLASLQAEVAKLIQEPKDLRITCNKIKKIGPPTYYPKYMVQHGMKAIIDRATNNGLVAKFDSSSAWGNALASYIHCK